MNWKEQKIEILQSFSSPMDNRLKMGNSPIDSPIRLPD